MSKEKEAQLKKLRKDMGECVIKASDILAEKNQLKTWKPVNAARFWCPAGTNAQPRWMCPAMFSI